MRGRWGWMWGLGLLHGCVPYTGGVGSGTAATLGGVDGDDTATDGVSDGPEGSGSGNGEGDSASMEGTFGGPIDTGSDDPDPSTTTTTGEPATTSDGDGPLLVITEGPSYDFGAIATGSQTTHLFTVSNQGDADATELSGLDPADPFAFTGGFPGAAGTCTTTLVPGSSCIVEVRFAPSQWGPYASALTITSDGSDATCDLVGGGMGQSENLLANPGGETQGTPPPSWTNAGMGNWTAGNPWGNAPGPLAGAAHLAAFDGPSYQDYVLHQDVSVEAWAALVDLGLLRVSFQGQARSYQNNNDSHRIRVRYRDAAGTNLATWDTDWLGTGSWTLRSDERLAPMNTRTVRVELMCRKTSGTHCDAFYDELELRASYP